MRELAILTLSRNEDHVRRLTAALEEQVTVPHGLVGRVLVNNANSVELTKAGLDGGWAVLEPGCNTSYSAGNNLAAKAAKEAFDPTHYLLLNDDAIPEPEFLARLWAQRDRADIVGALLMQDVGEVNHAGVFFGEHHADHIGRGQPRARWFSHAAPVCDAVTFAAVLIRRPVWHQMGGLDERYYYGFEDTDLCLRVMQAGGVIRCARGAVAFHGECGTRARHGRYDVTNARTFWACWKDKLQPMLAQYRERTAHLEE